MPQADCIVPVTPYYCSLIRPLRHVKTAQVGIGPLVVEVTGGCQFDDPWLIHTGDCLQDRILRAWSVRVLHFATSRYGSKTWAVARPNQGCAKE